MLEKKSYVVKNDEPVTIKIPAIEEWPISHLRRACQKNKVKGYSKMNKEQLVVEVKNIIDKFNDK